MWNSVSYINNDHCRLCCNWNYSTTNRFLHFPIPDKYPKTQHPTSPTPPVHREVIHIKYLCPVEQSFEWLKQGCQFCFHNVYYNEWNLGTSDEYIKSLGLPQSFNRIHIVSKAKELYQKIEIIQILVLLCLFLRCGILTTYWIIILIYLCIIYFLEL